MEGFGEAVFFISVGGNNVTNRIAAYLEHLSIEDKTGNETDVAKIVLNDSGGQLLLPGIGDAMTISLGWADTGAVLVFEGTVTEVTSRGGRHSGRTLCITAHGVDLNGKAKEPLEFHKDKATLKDFMNEAAGKAGLSFAAHPSIGSIMRDYWAAGTESFIHLGQRIAREVGASFKITAGEAFMWPMNSLFTTIQGGDGSIKAIWGDGDGGGNLIDWDIAPILARPRYKTARVRYYDPATATWNEKTKDVGGIGSDFVAEHTHRQTRADDGEASDTAAANSSTSEREAGSGDVTVVGNPAARPDGTCVVSNVRPGVDGTYRIDGITHTLVRGIGFRTKLDLKQPQGDAGTDGRGESGATGVLPGGAALGQGGIGHA